MALREPPSTAGLLQRQAAPPAGWQKMQALSNSSAAVLVERRNSQYLPEAHHVDPNVSTANQVSALLHDFGDSEPGSGRSASIPSND